MFETLNEIASPVVPTGTTRFTRSGDFAVFGPPSFQATAEPGSLPKRNVA